MQQMPKIEMLKKKIISSAWPTSLVKHKFHWVHLFAVLMLGSYFLISKVNLAHAFLKTSPIITFLQLFIFGTVFSYIFLYIFSHDRFFPFAKEIENKEEEKEKHYLRKYLHHGKTIATFIIGTIGGPLFLALTIRLLLHNYKYKYLLVFVTSFVSTLITFLLGKGVLNIFFRI